MGNSIAMAEQVLEQEEPVQETSKEEEGEAVEEKVKDEDEDGNAGGDEAGDENAVADGEAEEGSSEEEVEEEKPKITVDDVKTAPMDYRFPTTNQAKHCYTRYNEFHKCAAEKGEDAKECKKYAKYYRSLCPGDWIDKWNEERENGTFPGRY
ncbi:unnamed protein product [Sphagnum troendelagicum]